MLRMSIMGLTASYLTMTANKMGVKMLALLAAIFFALALCFTPHALSEGAVEGPNACVECHKEEGELWKKTHHYKTFRSMPRSKEARDISRKLGIRRLKTSKLCLTCHFTTQKVRNRSRVIAGISCESCHGKGQKYIEVHSGFSGKANKESEPKSLARTRWSKSEAAGMIRPKALYKTAKTCLGCHLVPQEKLVNVGGHPAGSPFELVAWSQGEVRHNVWYSKGKSNNIAKKARQRIMYLVGLAVELESALRAVGVATKRKTYAFKMARRVADARDKIESLSKALPNVPELAQMVTHGRSAWLRLNNKKSLHAAADKVAAEARKLASRYDGSKFGSIDRFLPTKSKYQGKPSR